MSAQHKEQIAALDSELEALRAQVSNLAGVYAAAQRLSEELARGAGDLASTLKQTSGTDQDGNGNVTDLHARAS